ncbi:MAG: hypothetical protein MPF33_00260 [Candidatus Aramenus sp.]|jgi:hypothetical protein|nr:hypothetical protein [Candidatus Aramenus sp.]
MQISKAIEYMRANVIVGIIAIILISVGVYEILTYHPSSHVSAPTKTPSIITTQTNSPQAPTPLSQDPKYAERVTGITPFYVAAWFEVNNLSGLPLTSGHVNVTRFNLGNVTFEEGAFEVVKHNSSTFAVIGFAKLNPSLNRNYIYALIPLLGLNFTVEKTGNYESFSYFYGDYSGAGIALGFNGSVFVGVLLNGTLNNVNYSAQLLIEQVNSLVKNSTLSLTPPDILPKFSMELAGWGYVNDTSILSKIGLNATISSGYIGFYTNTTSYLTLGVSQFANASDAEEAFSSIASHTQNVTENYTTGSIDGAKYLSFEFNSTSAIVAQYNNYLTYAIGKNANVLQAVVEEIKTLS